MAENNMISADKFKESVMSNTEGTTNFEWNGLTIEVKPVLSLHEMMAFMNYVIKLCFDEETGEYMPEIRDFAIASAAVSFYTNISLPDDTAERYELLYRSGIASEVYKHVCEKQIVAICSSIGAKLDHLASANAFALQKEFERTAEGFTDVLEQISKVFEGHDLDSISNILSSASQMGFDEEKLVNAIINQKNNEIKATQ